MALIPTTQVNVSPDDYKRKIAYALMQQGMDTSPVQAWTQGAARAMQGALGGYEMYQDDQKQKADEAGTTKAYLDFLNTGASPQASAMPQTAPTGGPVATALAEPDKIYSNNEPSPLDPPSGQDRTRMQATILGEENTPQGQLGVANVIRNRAAYGSYGGDTPSAVVQAPNQFEPWNTAGGRTKMALAMQDPKQVAAADDAIDRAYGTGKYVSSGPNDPTEGKTMFFSPGAQAALGRAPPTWAQGPGQMLGKTAFYDDNSDIPANAQPTQGTSSYQVAGPPTSPPGQSPTVTALANNPAPQAAADDPAAQQLRAMLQSSNPKTREMGRALASSYITSKMTADNTPVVVNNKLVTKTGKLIYDGGEDKKTSDIQNFEYGQSHPEFTGYQQSVKKPLVNIDQKAEGAAVSEAAKIDAETVRKGQNEKMPALDDADRNFQIMQDAIARNGGKLPTGGTLGKLGLDARRMSSYIRDNWGVDLGDDPTTAVSLETFNKGGIKASGDMAKAVGGNRVLKVEFDMAQRANPGLETTDGGNKYLLDVSRNTIAIQRDHLQAQEDYWRSHNHSLDGFQKEWNAEVRANPRPLSTFSVAPPIDNGDGSQMVKLPSTAQGGYSWYRKGQDGLQVIQDKEISGRLDDAAKPLRSSQAPITKTIGGKTYIKQDGNWFEQPNG